jgi:formylglycine-generating enzyme required for sulfatase activity/WD40 repeat protein
LFQELLAVELRYRTKAAEAFSREEYVRRFAMYEKIVQAIFAAASGLPIKRSGAANPYETISASEIPATLSTAPGNQAGDSPAASVDIPPDLINHPRYRILEPLGRGGMGMVFKAEHILMKRIVALKVISRSLTATPEMVGRFRREIEAAARLSHPNIVAAYDAEQAGETHLLVMEFIEGTDLGQLVKKLGRLSVANACACIRQAALGLQHAHEHRLIHRDIKPHNLMLTKEGRIKILDFGLARFLRENSEPSLGETAFGTALGTPDYMAPEQASDSHEVDIRADIYSLGCSLYHLLSGQVPFPGGSLFDKMLSHVREKPRSLGQLCSDLPVGLETIVAKMMAKDPLDRYQTPAEVAKALAPFTSTASRAAGIGPPPAQLFADLVPTQTFLDLAGAQRADRTRTRARVSASIPAILAGVVALGLLAVAGWLYFAQTQVTVKTAKGTLEITTDDPDVQVIVQQAGEKVAVLDLKTKQKFELNEGKYDLALSPGAKGLVLEPQHVALRRDQKAVATIRWIPEVQPGVSEHPDRMAPSPASSIPGEKALKAESVFTNSIGMKLALIPAGTFWMGSPSWGADWEKPEHEVVITKPFYLGIYPVTVGEFRKFVEETGYKTEAEADGKGANSFPVVGGTTLLQGPESIWRNSGWVQTDRHPVVDVSWNDAMRFCAWLSKKEGREYRLPTEAQWEYACRAGTRTRNSTGDDPESLEGYANVADASAKQKFGGETGRFEDGFAFTSPVGTFKPNPWGLYDMHGNVLQWCRDWYDQTYYAHSPREDPEDNNDQLPARSGILRGGAWNLHPQYCRSAYRHAYARSSRFPNAGFRVSLPAGVDGLPLKTSSVGAAPGTDAPAKRSAPETPSLPTVETGKPWVITPTRTCGRHQGPATCVAYYPKGKRGLALSGGFDNTVCLWDVESGKRLWRASNHEQAVWTVAFSPDGRRALSGNQDQTVRLWNVDTGQEACPTMKGHTGIVSSVAFLPERRRAVSACWDKTVRIWDLEKGKEVGPPLNPGAPILSIALNKDGSQVLLGSNDGRLRHWDLRGRKELRGFPGPTGFVEGVALTADDRQALAVGEDTLVHIYDLESGQELKTLRGHQKKVDCVTLSPDGRRVLSSGEDGTIRVWDFASGRELMRGQCAGKVRWVAFSPDGKRVVSACFDSSVALWELPALR